MNKMLRKAYLAALATVAMSASVSASVVVGGYTFADNAFADTVISSQGSFITSNNAPLATVLTDKDAGTFAFSDTPNAFVELGFWDNVVSNGTGVDLVLFELGFADAFAVTIGATTRSYQSVATGSSAGGFSLNAAGIDLADFNIAAGSSITSLRIGLDIAGSNGTTPSLSLVGALYPGQGSTVPEPASMALAALALAGLAVARRRSI